jgi:hypothetical protein
MSKVQQLLQSSSVPESKVYPHYVNCHQWVDGGMSRLMGKILTVIDASVSDPVQRKAVKDIVKTEFASIWAHDIRDSIVCGFKQLAVEFNDSWADSNTLPLDTSH